MVCTQHLDVVAESGACRSLMERMGQFQRAGTVKTVMLREQYRMHPLICGFASEQFYGGRDVLQTHESINKREPLW